MTTYIKNTGLALLLAFFIQSVSDWLQSPFIVEFLRENLITLLLALLAINTTTISVIMTKLREISDSSGVSFSDSIRAMKNSIVEQVILLTCAVVFLVLKESTLIKNNASWLDFVFNTFLITIMVLAVQVLYDTANGAFIIAQKEDEVETTENNLVSSNQED